MSQENNNDNIVTVSDAPVSAQQDTDAQQKAAKALGDQQQQVTLQQQNENASNNVPLVEQQQTLNSGITLPPETVQSAEQIQQQQAAPPTDSSNINVQDFINQTSAEIGNEEAAVKARNEKKLLLNKAVKSLNKVSTVIKKNVTTNEIIAEYIEYLPDNDGKSVYDYMKDPEVVNHIEFQFPEGKKEGDKLTEPISIFWKDTTF